MDEPSMLGVFRRERDGGGEVVEEGRKKTRGNWNNMYMHVHVCYVRTLGPLGHKQLSAPRPRC